eukprot:SM000074S21661  [mRNA]  locus=s74:155359:156783:- [translate_table: standard]
MGARRLACAAAGLALLLLVAAAEGRVVAQNLELPSLWTAAGSSAGAATCGPDVSIETPACTVEDSATSHSYEIRRYPSGQMWAITVVHNATWNKASYAGFYRCFDYISGENSEHEKIEMTAPVRIMPRPEVDGYAIGFFVPSRYDADSVPVPLDSRVKIFSLNSSTKAVLPVAGFPKEKEYEAKLAELLGMLKDDDIDYNEKSVVYVGYSGPFTVINRKQEVWIDII